jgi:ribonuclease BN (tRNA processing enzyme)
MELIVLGSGAFAPARERREVRNPAGCAVRLPAGILLFDLGFGDLWQLARAGLNTAAVTDVFLTHRHPDHVGDLAALLFHLRYDRQPRGGRLRLWGPPGVRGLAGGLRRVFRPWLEPRGYRLMVRELRPGGTARGTGWRVETCRAEHRTPALSYLLSAGDRSVVFSGDTGPNPALERFAAGCGALVIEATLPAGRRNPAHLNAEQAVTLARGAGPDLAVFTHLCPASAASLRRLLRRRSGLRGVIAHDLLRLKVPGRRAASHG